MSEPHTADLGTRYRYRREGAELERERIIKLLEENSANYPFCKCDTCERERFLIALIKGEQK